MIVNREEWPDLIQSALDGMPDDTGGSRAARLNELLRNQAEARELYLQMADVHSCLAVDEKLWVDEPNTDTFPLQSGFQNPNWYSH
ncbi:MAG: hypothetical protein JWL81_2199, partial [Verrucomicrobiales bacterium]|nr:hypothetical protein [Verrucomicrobiales bacterium]